MATELLVKIVAEATIVGGIAVTVLQFLITRVCKQLDDAEIERRMEHRQLVLWLAHLAKAANTWEKQLASHTVALHGINPSTASEERESQACILLRQLEEDLESQNQRLDSAILSIERVVPQSSDYRRL